MLSFLNFPSQRFAKAVFGMAIVFDELRSLIILTPKSITVCSGFDLSNMVYYITYFYTPNRVEDELPYIKMKPGWREAKIFDIIKNHRGINQKEIIKLSGMDKGPVVDCLNSLIEQKKIEVATVKQGEKIYFINYFVSLPTFEENVEKMRRDFQIIKSIIIETLENAQGKPESEATKDCTVCIQTLFKYKNGIESNIFSNTYKSYPRIWDELRNSADELLKEVYHCIKSEHIHGKISDSLAEDHGDSLHELILGLKAKNKTRSLNQKKKSLN